MKALPKNWSSLNKMFCLSFINQKTITCLLVFVFCGMKGQIANYVSDGSFEVLNSYSISTYYNVPKYWQPIDTGKASTYLATTEPAIKNAPGALGYQFPRTGKNYVICSSYCTTCPYPFQRDYPRNRLKKPLEAGKVYCGKYYIVNTNNSPLATDRWGMYFADSNLDTINYCNIPLSYLPAQIQNSTNNIITDTLNWVPITGTFVATGTEKYLVLGNFYSDVNTNTLLINPTFSTQLVNDICIDDVSVIELDLPAFAGRDTFFIPGDSIYIGRPSEVGIDEACMWYKLPNTTQAIDTVAGFWLKLTTTCTYVVKQDICGIIKYDTIVLYQSAIGINELNKNNTVKLYPNPAQKNLYLEFSDKQSGNNLKVIVYNSLGQKCKEEKIVLANRKGEIPIDDLSEGMYHLEIIDNKNTISIKKFVIFRQ